MTRGDQPTRWFRVQPIGYVRRPGAPEPDPEAFYDPWAETALEILPRWEDALAGIEEYSHLFVPWCTQSRVASASMDGSGFGQLADVDNTRRGTGNNRYPVVLRWTDRENETRAHVVDVDISTNELRRWR